MKKYLFIALALLGMASCAKDDLNAGNKPNHNGEIEESYIAINLMAADSDTRAINDDPYGNADEYGYEQGTTAERAVKTAYFFFFDENGDPFNVVAEQNNPATAPGGQKNHLPLSISEVGDPASNLPNVSDIKKAVLILSTYKGVYPSQIVAVINWTPTDNTYTLTQLHEKLAELGNDTDGYVMSNSVYMDGANKMVDATPLTAANIKTSSAEAIAAPIDIYVERIAAKVVLTASGKEENTTNIFDTQKDSTPILVAGESSEIDVYVQLHGWELYNDYNKSSLLKNIDTTWNVVDLGLTWNDIPYYRCYWANSQNTDPNDKFAWEYTKDDENDTYGGFPTAYGFNIASTADYTDYTDRTTYTYCGENTNGEAYRTKVILKGQLMQKKGANYEPLELARWYGTEYAGKDALKIAVANSLKYILYYHDPESGKQVSIEPGDLECIWGGDVDDSKAKAYEVYFKLSTTAESKVWSQYSSEEGYESFGDVANGENTANTNAYLMGVEPALLYTKGQTYYYVDIEHLGTAGAKYGVVRNHVYQIDIESISGYGSPVYIGTSNIVTPPDYPIEDEASYVAARINVLSWKVVKQGVDIVQ